MISTFEGDVNVVGMDNLVRNFACTLHEHIESWDNEGRSTYVHIHPT